MTYYISYKYDYIQFFRILRWLLISKRNNLIGRVKTYPWMQGRRQEFKDRETEYMEHNLIKK